MCAFLSIPPPIVPLYACQRIRALMELDVELKTLVVQMMRRLGT